MTSNTVAWRFAPNRPVKVVVIALFLKKWQRGGRGRKVFYSTETSAEAKQILQWFSWRWPIEHDIRDMKVTLGIENIRAKSDEMVQKELLCSMVAYNLVVQLRREAAKIAKAKIIIIKDGATPAQLYRRLDDDAVLFASATDLLVLGVARAL
ncbi:MAG: transposase [Planctomycetes bacterium]|nr:transposase [Planctomycetota bacterium]